MKQVIIKRKEGIVIMAKTDATPQVKEEEKKTTAKPAAVETKVEDVKEVAAKPAATKAEGKKEEGKTEAAKEEVKAEEKPAPKKRGRKPGSTNKKTAEKTAAATEKKETKTETKTATRKPKEPQTVQEVYIEYGEEQLLTERLVERIKEVYKAQGHRVSSIKQLRVYIKISEHKAYYVINEKERGSIDF